MYLYFIKIIVQHTVFLWTMTTQSSKKKFALSFISFGLVQLISQLASFFLIPLYTAKLSPTDYGSIEYASLFCVIIMILFSLQVQQGVVRFIADGPTEDEKQKIISTGFFIYTIGLASVSSAMCFVYLAFGYQFLFEDAYQYLFIWQLSYFVLMCINNFFFSILIWESKSKTASIISVSTLVSTLISTIVFILILDLSIKGYYMGLIFGQLVSVVLTLLLSKIKIKINFDTALATDLLKFSIPTIFSSLAFYSWFVIDRFMLNYYINKDAIGVFAIALKFASPLFLVTSVIETSMVPLIVKDPHSAASKDLLKNIFSIASLIVILYLLLVSCYSQEIFMYFVDAKFEAGASIIWCVCVGQLFAKWYFFNLGFTIYKKTFQFLIITLIGTFFNLLFTLYAIPRYGIVGAAVGTMLATFIFYGLIFYASHRLYPAKFQLKRFLILLIITGSVNYFFIKNRTPIFIKTLAFVVVLPILLTAYKEPLLKMLKLGWNQITYFRAR